MTEKTAYPCVPFRHLPGGPAFPGSGRGSGRGAAASRVWRWTFHKTQTCCGQPLFNSGFRQDAIQLGKRVLKSFAHSQYVVAPSGSCTSMLKVFYPELFRDDPVLGPQAKALSGKVYEFSQFLVKVLGVTDVGASHQGQGYLSSRVPPASRAGSLQGTGIPASRRRRTGIRGAPRRHQPAAALAAPSR